MDVSNIAKPEDLPFHVPKMLADDINALIEALERDDRDLDAYLDEVHGSARCLSEENDMRVRRYYVDFGWMNNDGRFDG